MSTTYKPTSPQGLFTPQQQQWITSELQSLFRALEAQKPHETFEYRHMAPDRAVAGMWVLADGTDWDPGSGVGAYRRNEANSEWVFVGSDTAALTAAAEATGLVLQFTASELQRLSYLAQEQLRQLTKIALLLSHMSGVSINDGDVQPAFSSSTALRSIATTLSLIAGVAISDDQLSIPS